MKITFTIDYHTAFGQNIAVLGNLPQLGEWHDEKALLLVPDGNCIWTGEVETADADNIEYVYLVKEGKRIVRREWGKARSVKLDSAKNFALHDLWHDTPPQRFLYTSAFTDSFFAQNTKAFQAKYLKNSILLNVICPYIAKNQKLILSGAGDYFGNWNAEKAIELQAAEYGRWQVVLNAQKITSPTEFKLAILDLETKKITHWEEGNNRTLYPVEKRNDNSVHVLELQYKRNWLHWKTTGVAVPVFALRSEKSFGIGEFSDLKLMIDWATNLGMKIIQILPINDTTITHKWTDSYPYNAISIYALHPVYLGLAQFPLADKAKFAAYQSKANALNTLPEIDYEQVLALKEDYLCDLFAEIGAKTLKTKAFADFFARNEEWLFPYAAFTQLRDKFSTADFNVWTSFSRFDKQALQKTIDKDKNFRAGVEQVYFTQFLLHTQLSEIKEYAHQNEVILKGDIPIGISRASVEAWVEPQLFNLDTQTGAPPDDFSVFGQNWGFPTYNWERMAADGYSWWAKRFRKMADYFDAYRIDHILGFFRIWEIPQHSVQGLLGYFSPALPFTEDEIKNWMCWFDEYRMTNPYIHEHFLSNIFGEYTAEVIENYLNPIAWQIFELKEFCNTQQKIKLLFAGKTDDKTDILRNGLYALCNEVLFVRDRREPNKFHPRITAQTTYSYRDLDENTKSVYNRLYNHFFYERHNEFWGQQAMKKLPTLINSTNMLVCGEDLGMIPDCVPAVLRELQIISLEIQRMPKDPQKKFENLNTIPYLSVCTTSTHDMSPIRLWWTEDRNITQQFFNEMLWNTGAAPEDATPEICWQIIEKHLNSPAMLTILPLQDWLAIDGKLRRANPAEERINIPANPQHYWRYRMHITLEKLLKSNALSEKLKNFR
ncbi:MAG: 4-alpha-glucanotransferase [Paludibacter sp.]|jgi:4-alpha-glucanotransferase|nr:4-alpha-glucanotransferase [Paludibacter sp.]